MGINPIAAELIFPLPAWRFIGWDLQISPHLNILGGKAALGVHGAPHNMYSPKACNLHRSIELTSVNKYFLCMEDEVNREERKTANV